MIKIKKVKYIYVDYLEEYILKGKKNETNKNKTQNENNNLNEEIKIPSKENNNKMEIEENIKTGKNNEKIVEKRKKKNFLKKMKLE